MPALKNARHEAFCQAMMKGKNQSEALVIAGFPDSSSTAVRASQIYRRSDVIARMAELQAKVEAKFIKNAVYDAQTAMDEAKAALDMAMERNNPGAAVQAVMLRAKLMGLLIEKKEVRTGTLDEKTDDELDGIIRNAAAEAQISFGIAGEGTETQH